VTKRGYGVQIIFQDVFFAILIKKGLKLKKCPQHMYIIGNLLLDLLRGAHIVIGDSSASFLPYVDSK
jgi:hypothetical protein